MIKTFKLSITSGLPQDLKGYMWLQMQGNTLRITPQLYKLNIERGKLIEANLDKEVQFRKTLKIIEEDLHRTFGELGHFRYGNKFYQPLRNILVAFAIYRPDLGYIQGMSFVAGAMLLNTNSEYDTFCLFANLMTNSNLLYNFYTFNMDFVNLTFHLFMNQLKIYLPLMH